MKVAAVIFSLLIVAVASIILLQSNQTSNSQKRQPTSQTNAPQASTASDNVKRPTQGKTPNIPIKVPSGYSIFTFASNLGTARDLQFSPAGTLLVSNPSTNQVIALPDKNGDGEADSNKVVIENENVPHGLAFYNDKLYVASVDKVTRYNWDETHLTATKEKELFSLPQNRNHNRRTIVFDKDGNMFVSVGSTCNVCNEESPFSATIIQSNAEGKAPTVFAKGLRNAPFLQFNPKTDELWVTEMGRDNLGDDIPPDEINIVKKGQDYGWPNCYGQKVADLSFNSNASCQNTQAPIFEIQAHSAPLGLVFINSTLFPADWQDDLLVAYHGSWNRSTPTGYKVVRMRVEGNTITSAEDFITGFLPTDGGRQALGRPVDLTFDKEGNLYISDDRAGNVYIIKKE